MKNTQRKAKQNPLGNLIRSRRMELGLGLSDVARSCRCSVQFISNIEHGRAPLPWTKVAGLAKVLKLQPARLQAVNLSVRSDFKGFAAGEVLKPMQEAVTTLTLTAKDPGLRRVLEMYQWAGSQRRKQFVQTAQKLLSVPHI